MLLRRDSDRFFKMVKLNLSNWAIKILGNGFNYIILILIILILIINIILGIN